MLAADPITYGRLLCSNKVFRDNELPAIRRAKLTQLLATLPDGNKAKHARSSYIFFCMKRRKERKELKEELDNVSVTERMLNHLECAQMGAEWNWMTEEEKQPFVGLASLDKARYEYESKPEVWDKLMARRILVLEALVNVGDDDTVLRVGGRIRLAKRKRAKRELWFNHHVDGLRGYRQQLRVVNKKHKVPKSGASAYNFFMKDVYKQVRKELDKREGEFNRSYNTRVMREIGIRWRRLMPDQKNHYKELSRQDRLKRAREAIEQNPGVDFSKETKSVNYFETKSVNYFLP